LAFTRCCGGLFATTFTARSKRCQASGSNSTSCFFLLDLDMPFEPVEPFAQAIGNAIIAYAEAEQSQAMLFSGMLTLKHDRANAVFYTIQNVRARNEMIQTLLRQEFKEDYAVYWESCSEFLLKLAKFRNAVAHWHPAMRVYMSKGAASTKPGENVLSNPSPGWGIKSLTLEDIGPFMKDCRAIQQEMYEFTRHIDDRRKAPRAPLPDRFQKRVTYRNQAVLQRHPKPKAQKSPPRSSHP